MRSPDGWKLSYCKFCLHTQHGHKIKTSGMTNCARQISQKNCGPQIVCTRTVGTQIVDHKFATNLCTNVCKLAIANLK